MELIKRNIKITDYQCLNTVQNVKVFNGFLNSDGLLTSASWSNNIPEYNNIPLYILSNGQWIINPNCDITQELTFNPFGRVMADFILPKGNGSNGITQYNPYYSNNDIILPYSQIRRMYNDIVRYQDFITLLCQECKLDIANFITDYIDLIDQYYYSDGDFLLKYSANLLFTNLPKYIPLSTGQSSFLNYILAACGTNTSYPFDFTNDYSLLIIFGNTTSVNNFIHEYVLLSNKIMVLIDLITNYILNNNTSLPNDLRDTNSEVRNIVTGFIYDSAINYYNLYSNCNFITIPFYTNYNYVMDKNPTISIPILITSDFEDLGISFNPVEDWVLGKRYYVGDVVLFNDFTYILKDTNPSSLPFDSLNNQYYFTGALNPLENIIYFDNFNKDSNGFTTSLIMNGNNYTHWIRNVKNNYSSNDEELVQARIDSQIATLRSYRKSSFTNFWDPFGNFKTNVYFNQETFTDNNGVSRIYQSYISDVYKKDTLTFWHNGIDVTSSTTTLQSLQALTDLFGFNINEIGHDFVLYQYTIDEAMVNNKVVNNGIQFSEVYHRYKIDNNGNYVYDFQEQPFISYQISNSNTINNFTSPNLDNNNIYLKGEPEILNYAPQSKLEYENNIVFSPYVESDVFVDRGINYAWDKHLKLSEIKSLAQLYSYNNGGFFTINNNN